MPEAVLVDAAYDSDEIRGYVASQVTRAVIKPIGARSRKLAFDRGPYWERN